MLMPQIQAANVIKEPPRLDGKQFDQEAILPFALIREHTKADDVLRVSDALLGVYRDAALEAAEEYTGMVFREQRVVTQDVATRRDLTAGHKWKQFYKVRLKQPTVDGVLYLYSSTQHQMNVQTIIAEPGATVVQIPYSHYTLDMTPCCGDPCGKLPGNHGMHLMYRAGLGCEKDVPRCVIMGCLKYIAWQINNPGDQTGGNLGYASTNPQASGNNASWQSGAVEEWRLCVRDAY